jgi:hypothetical protein
MNKLALLFAAAALLAISASAQNKPIADHLIPEESPLSMGYIDLDYDELVGDALMSGTPLHYQVVVIPSFSPEYLVGLRVIARTTDGSNQPAEYTVVARTPDRHLYHWLREIRHKINHDSDFRSEQVHAAADIRQVKIKECQRKLDSALGMRIAGLFETMLSRTTYPAPSEDIIVGSDGTDYHFSGRVGAGRDLMAGQTWSPCCNTAPAMLVDIVDGLKAWCENGDAPTLTQVSKRTEELERALKITTK